MVNGKETIRFEVVYMVTLCSACHMKLTHIRGVLTDVCTRLLDAEWSERKLKTRDELLELADLYEVPELPLPVVLMNGRLLAAGRIPMLQEILDAVDNDLVKPSLGDSAH